MARMVDEALLNFKDDCTGDNAAMVVRAVMRAALGVTPCEGCKPRPLCRDCADNDGTCPNDGLPCDPKARHTCGKYAAGVAEPLKENGNG